MTFKHRFCLAMMVWAAFAMLFIPDASAQATNPDVTQDTIAKTICVPGWTKTVRPSSSYTNRMKAKLVRENDVPGDQVGDYELDHIIPLSSGGATRDPRNLMLQPWAGPQGAKAKDVQERRMQRRICSGAITLEAAQAYFITHWSPSNEDPIPHNQ